MHRPKEIPQWMLLAIIAAAALACYSASFGFQFVYDDVPQIVQNPGLRSLGGVAQFFSTAVGSHQLAAGISNYYRPVFLSWLSLNYFLFGISPAGWHVTTVVVHIGVCWLVYAFALRLFAARAGAASSRGAAFAGALLFAAHPAHVESVAWVSGVTDPLLALLLLASYMLWTPAPGKPSTRAKQAVAIACFALALLTKETALIFPLLLLAHEKIERRRSWASSLRTIIPFLLVIAAYLPAREHALHGFSRQLTPLSPAQQLLNAPLALAFYLRQLCFPAKLALYHDFDYALNAADVRVWLCTALAAAVFAALWMAIRTEKRELGSAGEHSGAHDYAPRPITIASACLIIPLLPVLNVALFQPQEAVHDRYLYLPSIGFCILLVALARSARAAWQQRGGSAELSARLSQAATVVLVVAMAAQSAVQSTYWANDLVLFAHSYEVAPHSKNARNNLASELFKRGMYGPSETLYRAILREDPGYWLANLNLGVLCLRKGDAIEASDLFRRAVALNPGDPDGYIQLAAAQLASGYREAAIATLQSASEIFPNYAPLRAHLRELQAR